MPNEPLDARLLDLIEVEEDSQLEIVDLKTSESAIMSNQLNPSYADWSDTKLDEALAAHRSYFQLPLPDTGKLMKKVADLEREKAARMKRRESNVPQKVILGLNTRDMGFPVGGDKSKLKSNASLHESDHHSLQTDCSGRWEKNLMRNTKTFSDEVQILNASKGKAPFSLNAESPLFDVATHNSRIYSGELAAPSVRQGLRSSSKQCLRCNRRSSPSNATQIGNDKDCECYVRSSLPANSYLEKDSAKSNLLSGFEFGRKGNGGKRPRQGVGSDDSLESVVELFSSEEDEEKETRDTLAHCNVSNQRKGYGTRNTGAVRMEKIAYPSRDDPEAVEVLYHDLHRLQPMEFLNDTLIDFYIKYIQRPEVLRKDHRSKFYFFNSFFYKKLSELVGGQGKKPGPDLSKLRKWTKGTNIFEKEYLFIPIHDKWHWSLAIICHPGSSSEDSDSERCILHLDSMCPGHKSTIVFRLLRMYLLAEWEHQANEDRIGISHQKLTCEDFIIKKVNVPQQENESDCGLFLLHYIECFLKDAPSSFKWSDVDQGKLFGKDWFEPSMASSLRKRLLILLQDLFKDEEDKRTGNAETIAMVPSQHLNSKSQLQIDEQQFNESVDNASKPLNSGHFSCRSQATEPVYKNNHLGTCEANLESSSASIVSRDLQLEVPRHGQESIAVSSDENFRAGSSLRTVDVVTSSSQRLPRSRLSADLQSSSEHLAKHKCTRLGSADDKVKDTSYQLNCAHEGEFTLVIDLSIKE